jgi:CBS domain-containing protein
MAEEAVGALAVCDGREHPVGVVTDRDLVVRVLAQGEDPSRITVSDCLDGEVDTLDADAPLSEAAARMRAAAVRRLPVLRAGRLAEHPHAGRYHRSRPSDGRIARADPLARRR